jgi:ABC-2 type transport system ATP-binding protein
LPSVELVDFTDNEGTVFEVHSNKGQNSAKAIFDLCVKKGWFLAQLTPIETKLEDIFREVTQN